MSRFSPQSRTRSSASGSSRSDLERKLAVGNPSLKWTMDESNICDTNPLGVCESIGSKRNIRQALPWPMTLTRWLEASLKANSSTCPGVSTISMSHDSPSISSKTSSAREATRSAARIWAPLGPSSYSIITSDRETSSLTSNSVS